MAAVVIFGVFVGRPAEGGGALAFRGLFQDDAFFPENLHGVLEGSFRQGLGPLHFSQLVEFGADGLDALQKFLLAPGLFLEKLDGAKHDPVGLQVVEQQVGEVGQVLEAGSRQGIGGLLGVEIDHHPPGGKVFQGLRYLGLRVLVAENEFVPEKILEEAIILHDLFPAELEALAGQDGQRDHGRGQEEVEDVVLVVFQ